MATKRLEERFAYQGGQVDRAGARPVIRDVLLCGATSANRRRYRKEAFAGDGVKKYADRPVYLDHGDGKSGRRYGDQVGWVRNPRLNAAGMPIGDLEVKPKHPLAEQLLDDAQNDPKAVGMSHVANCKTATARDGWEEIESIESIESVDVVLDPATTNGFFENRNRAMPLTIKALLEALIKHPKVKSHQVGPLKALAEDAMLGDMPSTMDAPPADDADPADGVKDAFSAACMSVIGQALDGEMEPKDALAKLKEMLLAHGKVNGKAAPADDAAAAAAAEEAKKKPVDVLGILKECRAECGPDFTPGEALLETLCALPDAAKRKALLVEHKTYAKAGKEQPRSGAPRNQQTRTEESKVPTDGKAFAASIRD